MDGHNIQRGCINFFLLGKMAAETMLMLQNAFKEEDLSETQVYTWFSCFKRGLMSLKTNQDLANLP